MDILNTLLECIPCATPARKPTIQTANSSQSGASQGYVPITEKPTPLPNPTTTKPSTPDEAASQILTALLCAPKRGPILDATIHSIIRTQRPSTTAGGKSWYASLAEAVFHRIVNLLKEGRTHLTGAMADAFRDASAAVDAVEEFARAHPLWTAAVVAVVVFGMLVLLAPYLLEALGFAELGPVEGSFAAGWQAEFLGAVPKGSLFAFFQRLGMVWGKGLVVLEV